MHRFYVPILFIGFVILTLVGSGVFYFFQKEDEEPFTPQTDVPLGYGVNIPAENPPYPQGEVLYHTAHSLGITPYMMEVSWEPKPIQTEFTHCGDGISIPGCVFHYEYNSYYRVGTITTGALAGLPLYVSEEAGMGVWYEHVVIIDDKELRLEENKFTIKGIDDIPEVVSMPNSQYKLKKFGIAVIEGSSYAQKRKEIFTVEGVGTFYLGDDGCMFIILPDHTHVTYDFVFPFVEGESSVYKIVFTDGTTNQEEYEGTRILGCGMSCIHLATVGEEEIAPSSRLVVLGATVNGEPVYGYKNAHDPSLEELYNDKNTLPYVQKPDGTWGPTGTSRYTYEEFLGFKPLLYWKDPVGRWIEFKNKRFLFAAEKCKPVIYLYPLETEHLTVKVHPNGGFLHTIPEYGNDGWHVEAHPDGTIIDSRTGESYPYLYWSGIGVNYPDHKGEGWMVKKEEVATFLDETLPKLGLRGKEIDDFKEYWVTKLSETPYYQISFLTKNEFDTLAPLSVEPKRPNTVIRVFMTAKGYDAPQRLRQIVLPELPERKGFTLVEWGGSLLR